MGAMMQALLGGGPLVLITNNSASNNLLSGIGGTATATYRLGNNGVAQATDAGGTLTPIAGQWLLSGAASAYEARGTWSGTGGTVGGVTTWTSLANTQDWTLQVTNNLATRDLTLEIGLAGTSTAIATATINFSVDSAP